MRAFIGIDFSKELKKKVADMQLRLKPYASSGRWKYIDNFHLTLKFLGEIDLSQLSAIDRELREICSHAQRFRLKISGAGFFPGKDCLRVLWLGLGGDVDMLNWLQRAIDTKLESIGFKKEKRGYTPHITVGQDIVFTRGFDEIKNIIDSCEFPEATVDCVYLFESEQVGGKRVYTPLGKYLLQH